ncbi:MAG: bacterioferritin [Thiothrix sp.]|nr:bacterioferritin [Thiothrix sp.]HPQ94739.1 bacterioferritin [Thiolinea sp.]
MKGNPDINRALNQALRHQLTAINQYFLHARMYRNWGLEKLNNREYQRSIKAMKQADTLIERILFLEGLPNLQDLGKLYLGEGVPEMLASDLRLATEVTATLRTVIAACEQDRDYVSRDMLKEILEAEEAQIDWLESQQWALDNTGLQNYQQSMMND